MEHELKHNIVITLEGELNGSEECLLSCDRLVRLMSIFDEFTVNATAISLVPEGVEAWKKAVASNAQNSKIVYQESQLGLILRFDSDYKHPNSVFAWDE